MERNGRQNLIIWKMVFVVERNHFDWRKEIFPEVIRLPAFPYFFRIQFTKKVVFSYSLHTSFSTFFRIVMENIHNFLIAFAELKLLSVNNIFSIVGSYYLAARILKLLLLLFVWQRKCNNGAENFFCYQLRRFWFRFTCDKSPVMCHLLSLVV